MANPNPKIENLTHELTTKELRKGGIRSAQVRKEKKLLKDYLEIALSIIDKDTKEDNYTKMVKALLEKAYTGDTKAFEVVRDTIGQKPVEHIQASAEINNPYQNLSEEELRKLAK